MRLSLKLPLLILSLLFNTGLNAQDKYDFTWILGYAPSNPNLYFGGNNINFKTGNPITKYFPIDFDMANPICMSDSVGNLQFYSSGCNVINSQNEIIENGDDLSSGFFQNYYCKQNSTGYLSYQGIISLPKPGKTGEYILIHNRQYLEHDSIDFLYSCTDMNANNGMGKMTIKNIPLAYGYFSLTLSAVKHGNGRDWWIITSKQNSDTYFLYLLDTSGIHGPIIQEVSKSWITGQYFNLMGTFSPNGKKFVRLGGEKPAKFRIYDFDRCAGLFSNPIDIDVPDTIISSPWACFSPNSRFLYLTNEGEHLYQFDIESDDINSSVQLIGNYDGFLSVYNLPTGFLSMTLGPDNRIYMSSGNGVNVMHTINNPDLPGLSSGFVQHNIILPAHNLFYLPNNANYRLYNELNSPCDTLGIKAPIVAFWRAEQDTLSAPLNMNFTDLSYHQPIRWYWDFGDGSSDTTQFPLHTYATPGIYTVCLEACNALGVCDSLCREISIITVGTQTVQTSKPDFIQIAPNPVQDVLNVQFEEPFSGKVDIYNAAGVKLLEKQIPSFTQQLQSMVQSLPPSVYILVATNEAGYIFTARFVIAR